MAAAELTLAQESSTHFGFHVPQFELRIDGVSAPHGVIRDVIQVTYNDDITKIDTFDITVNNWDADLKRPKYIGFQPGSMPSAAGSDEELARLFEPSGKEVTLRMGYVGDLRLMMRGTFTGLDPNFPASGAPTLNVHCQNVLHKLARKSYSQSWTKKRDSEIAKDLATLTDAALPGSDKRRIPYPLVIDSNAVNVEEPLPVVHQDNETDLAFLMARARQLGYVLCVREGDPAARSSDARERHLYFGPSDGHGPGERGVTYRLKWGASLVDFKPTLNVTKKVTAVTVKGWDRTNKREFSAKVSLNDLRPALDSDLSAMLGRCGATEITLANQPVHSENDARRRATARLRDSLKDVITASATTVGLPDLRAGCRVMIEGLGPIFSGTYFVTSTTHTFGDSGYTTKFNARREQSGAVTSR